MTVGLMVEHLGSNLIGDLSGFDEIYAKQAGCDREQAGQAVKQKSLEPQSSEIFLRSDLGTPHMIEVMTSGITTILRPLRKSLPKKAQAAARNSNHPAPVQWATCGADRAKTGGGEPPKWSFRPPRREQGSQ